MTVLIDELQYFTLTELAALIMAMHKVQQRQLPLVLLGTGLPILPGLAGESKSYAERLFSFPDIGALSEEDTAKALQEPARASGVAFEPRALKEIFRLAKRTRTFFLVTPHGDAGAIVHDSSARVVGVEPYAPWLRAGCGSAASDSPFHAF